MKKIPRGQTPERKAYMAKYVATHPKRDRRAYKKAYDEAHREENKEYARKNRERLKAAKRAYYLEHREERIAYVLKYQRENAYRIQHAHNRLRARKYGNGGSHTFEELRDKFEKADNKCHYCGEKKALTIDHDIPLSLGGSDDITNILPACRSCNAKKGLKTAAEYLASLRQPPAKN